jgi:hypothetical protein
MCFAPVSQRSGDEFKQEHFNPPAVRDSIRQHSWNPESKEFDSGEAPAQVLEKS